MKKNYHIFILILLHSFIMHGQSKFAVQVKTKSSEIFQNPNDHKEKFKKDFKDQKKNTKKMFKNKVLYLAPFVWSNPYGNPQDQCTFSYQESDR